MPWPLSMRQAAKITFAQWKCRTSQGTIYPAEPKTYGNKQQFGMRWKSCRPTAPFYCILKMPLHKAVDKKHSGQPNTTRKFPFKTCGIISGSSTSVMVIAWIQMLFKYCTWSSINERRREITTITLERRGVPQTMSATMEKLWKLSDFPKPVGKFTNTFFALKKALIASCCSGSRSVKKLCFDCLKGFFPLLFASRGHSLPRSLFYFFCSLPVQTPLPWYQRKTNRYSI